MNCSRLREQAAINYGDSTKEILTCFICKINFPTINCLLQSTSPRKSVNSYARNPKYCFSVMKFHENIIDFKARGCCCNCCKCPYCMKVLTDYTDKFKTIKLPAMEEGGIIENNTVESAAIIGSSSNENFNHVRDHHDDDQSHQPEFEVEDNKLLEDDEEIQDQGYSKYLQMTVGRVRCVEEVYYRAKVEIMAQDYCSVCMPAVSNGLGGWCTDDFPVAISDQLRRGDAISKHMLRGQYHSCHVFRNVQFLSGEKINIGVCNCKLSLEFSGDNCRSLLETIMFEIFNNSAQYSSSEFNEMVHQKLRHQEIFIGKTCSGLKYLECIHSKVVFEALVGNEIARQQEFVQLPYPGILNLAIEFPISNWMLSALNNYFSDDVSNEQYNFIKLAQEENPDYTDVSIMSAAIAVPKVIQLQGMNENQQFSKRREGVFAVKTFENRYINNYGEVRKCKGQPRFSTLISVSITKKIFCYHCTEHVTFCPHATLVKSDALSQISELEQVKRGHRDFSVRKWIEDAIIPVPISVSNVSFTAGHNMDAIFELERLNLFQLPNDSMLNPLVPFSTFHKLYDHTKSYRSNHPAFYHSRQFCECGTPWDSRFCLKEASNAILYAYSSVRELPIYYCKCQNPCCSKIFNYNGFDDGLIVLYLDSRKRKVVVPAIMMIRSVSSIHDGCDTLEDKYDFIQRSYTASMQTSNFKAWESENCYLSGRIQFDDDDDDSFVTTSLRFMPRDAFSGAVKYVAERMMFPFLLSSMCTSCPNCGPNPRVICIDGIALGVKWYLFKSPDGRIYFNTPISQKPPPSGDSVIFLNKSLNESEYTFLQGTTRNMTIKYIAASQVAEKFNRGFYKENEYTFGWYIRLIEHLQFQSETEDNARAALYLIRQRRDDPDRDFLLDSKKPKLLNVEQSILGSTPGSIPMISSRHGGGFLFIAYAALSLGVPATSKVPKCFFEIWATETVDIAIAESVLANTYNPVFDQDVQFLSNKFSTIVDNFLNIDSSIDVPERLGVNESSGQFCSRICRSIIKNILIVNVKRQLYLNDVLRRNIREYSISDEISLSLIAAFEKTFPQLYDYLFDPQECPDQTCDQNVRPLFAYLARMAANIWFRPVTFQVHRVVNNKTQRVPLANITLDDVCRKARMDNYANDRYWGRDYRELLLEFVEQYQQIKLGSESGRYPFEEDFMSGSACFEPELENYRHRGMFHSVDLTNSTNSSAAAEESLNNNNNIPQRRQRHDDDDRGVDDCKKSFPGNPIRSYGFFAIMCTCEYHCIYSIFLMDKGESCRMAHDAILNRFKEAPIFIFYDNGCHLKAYCIVRNPIYFFKTTFLIDDLHGKNHVAICSCTHLRHPFNSNIEIAKSHTQVCEIFFAQLRRSAASQLAEMNAGNAVIMIKIYGILYNANQFEKFK